MQFGIEVAVGAGKAGSDIGAKPHRKDHVDGCPDPSAEPISRHIGGSGLGKAETAGAKRHTEQAEHDHASSSNDSAGQYGTPRYAAVSASRSYAHRVG